MTAVQNIDVISVNDYLAAELVSPTKHEFVGGSVYRRPYERNTHNIISGNILVSLHPVLRKRKCRPFNSDTKIRIRLPTQVRFYYPDASVVCRQNSQDESFQDEPAVIFEVVSNATRRIDHGEKKDAFLTIPWLDVYVLLEQEFAGLIVYRRTEQGFVREVYEGLDAILPLPEIDAELPLREIYEGVEFSPEGEAE